MAKGNKNGSNTHTAKLVGPANVADTSDGQMVLRTVFIPSKQDRFLKDLAAQKRVSKGELIRRAIDSYLSEPLIQ